MAADTGSASLEFITAGLLLLVPLVYLVVAMSLLQGGALAVEGAARQAARVFVLASNESEALARAERAVHFSLSDYGIDAAEAQVSIGCSPVPAACLTRQNQVTVTVRIQVRLPLVPDLLSLPQAASVPVQAVSTQTVSRFWGQR